jgi:predicted ATP-binding protein involved in virulence
MRIDEIHLSNVKKYADLTVRFGPKFNVIVGANGSGKTSVLSAISEILVNYAFALQSHFFNPLSDQGWARLKLVSEGNGLRFEPQYPVEITFRGELFSKEESWLVKRVSEVAQSSYSYDLLGRVRDQIDSLDARRVQLPVMAYYRASRNWKSFAPNEMVAASTREGRKDGYANWFDASNDSAALQTWIIAKSLERLQAATDRVVRFDAVQDDELAVFNQALADAVDGARGMRYDLKMKMLLVEWSTGKDATPFENLSDGQRAIIGLIGDIARRMCLLNPYLKMKVTHDTPGIVLIDELDMHLHPGWQRILTRGLKKAFPSVQFIVASHSPQVLGELHPDEIILLRGNDTAHPQVSYGMDSSRVLEEIMDAPSRPAEVEAALESIFNSLESNDLSHAREEIDALRKLAPGVAEIGGAEALLKRKELIGR